MVINCKEFEKNISKKGFKLSQGGKHRKYIFYYNGTKTNIIAEVSRNDAEFRDTMISMLTKQLQFDNKNDLKRFAVCTLSESKYINILLQKNLLN